MIVKHLEDLINQTNSSTPLMLLMKQHTSTKLMAGDPRAADACVAGAANASISGGHSRSTVCNQINGRVCC